MKDLRILLIEDNEDDALLILNELKYAGFNIEFSQRVWTTETLREALNAQWDIVLSDYNLATFNGLEALQIVRGSYTELPFILISGAIGEETAVNALKAGANDYLLKDRLSRLPIALTNEMMAAEQRKLLKQTQDDLINAKQAAEWANQRKSQVLAYVSHEFKNPIKALDLYLDLLQQSLSDSLNEKQQQYIESIRDVSALLTNTVADILDITAIEANKITLNITPLDLDEQLEQIKTIILPIAKKQAVDFIIKNDEPNLAFEGDSLRFRQVFINIISNAIKYTPEGQNLPVILQVNRDAKDPNMLCFRVVDQGIGISKEEQVKLFQEYYRVNNRLTSQKEGLGLGLALTKRLIEKHHGKINLQSQLGCGTTVSVFWPLKQIFSTQ